MGSDLPARRGDEATAAEAVTREEARLLREERLRQREPRRDLRTNEDGHVPARRGDDQTVRRNVDRNARDVGRTDLAAALGAEPKNDRSLRPGGIRACS